MSKLPSPVKRQVAIALAYKSIFESPDGRLVLTDLMHRAGVLHAVHEDLPGQNDYNNGRRSLVLDILKQLRFNEAALLELSQARLDEFAEQE